MEIYLTRTIHVKKNRVVLNGAVLYLCEEQAVSKFLASVYRRAGLNYPKFFKMDHLCRLAFLSAELLLQGTDVVQRYPAEEIGIIVENGSSCLESDEKHRDHICDRGNYFPHPSTFVYTLPNIMTGEIAIRHKIKGENTVFISEHPDSDFLYHYISELFRKNRVSCCIGGWIDCYGESCESFLFTAERGDRMKGSPAFPRRISFGPMNMERLFTGEAINGRPDFKAEERDH